MNMEPLQRTMAGGQLESQRLPLDRLIDDLLKCVKVGSAEDELMGIDLPDLAFDRQRARQLIQDFLDERAVGKGI